MRLNKIEGEVLRKRVKILIPQIEKSEIVNLFQIEGYPAEIRAGFSYIIVRGCRFGKLNK